MKTKRLTYPIAALMIVILAACNLPQATSPTEKPLSVEEAFTAAAQTVEVKLTGGAQTQAASGASTATPAASNTPQPEAAVSATPTLQSAATATATSVAITATSTQICDQAQFITDVTVPDGSNYSAGDTFTKTWRIKNVGTCSWTPSYTLFFSSGSQMNGPTSIALTGNVNPGQSVEISVNLTAPASAGDYTGYWKLRNAAGLAFTSMYVKINVGSSGSDGGAFRVTHVDYSSSGGCSSFTVTAKITVNAAGTVTYHWVRSDGATDTLVHDPLVFGAAGDQSVSTSWATTASGAKWISIYIDEPNHQQIGKAEFSCP